MQYQKVKSVSKQVLVKGPVLEKTVLETMKTVSSVVGATLGPCGRPVLIERPEHGLPSYITKDGVTVFRSLGMEDSASHCIMEVARDAAIRTANEAGDGTTTATVLAEAITRNTSNFVKRFPKFSPQRVTRELERIFKQTIEPVIRGDSIDVNSATESGQDLMRSVASVSANGDTALADAVIECFGITGDEGNVTIVEVNGPSGYEVEHVKGYPIGMGYEDSCGKFYPQFINDAGNQRTFMENPVFILYHGRITEVQAIHTLLSAIDSAWHNQKYNHNIVLVATGFSDNVLGVLAGNFPAAETINIFPLIAPQSPIINGQLAFLQDLAAITGASILDPISRPLSSATIDDLGPVESNDNGMRCNATASFEATRFRSLVIPRDSDDAGAQEARRVVDDLVLLRVDELKQQLTNPASQLDKMLLEERVAKLTGGIARLKVIGASNGETKEKRDRAEDAVCAVRGALKHGCLPGGGWMLLRVMKALKATHADPVTSEVLIPSLFEPVHRLLTNCGLDDVEIAEKLGPVISAIGNEIMEGLVVYDALNDQHVNPFEGGILDSTPAVLEAIRNSISIAGILGTLGGTVVYKRDAELERREAQDTAQFLRDANSNPSEERA